MLVKVRSLESVLFRVIFTFVMHYIYEVFGSSLLGRLYDYIITMSRVYSIVSHDIVV